MSKIYLLAVNWGKITSVPKQERAFWVKTYDAPASTDIAGFTTYFPVKEWRIYAFTIKQERQKLIDDILKKEN